MTTTFSFCLILGLFYVHQFESNASPTGTFISGIQNMCMSTAKVPHGDKEDDVIAVVAARCTGTEDQRFKLEGNRLKNRGLCAKMDSARQNKVVMTKCHPSPHYQYQIFLYSDIGRSIYNPSSGFCIRAMKLDDEKDSETLFPPHSTTPPPIPQWNDSYWEAPKRESSTENEALPPRPLKAETCLGGERETWLLPQGGSGNDWESVAITFDYARTPDLTEWAQKQIANLLVWYPIVTREIAFPYYDPPGSFSVVIEPKPNPFGAAYAIDAHIVVDGTFIRQGRQGDLGTLVHEMTHVIQTSQPSPSWVVEGVADWVRYYLFNPGTNDWPEPGDSYKDGYGHAAFLLNHVVEHYDSQFIRQLNFLSKQGRYSDDCWTKVTGKGLDELWKEAVGWGFNTTSTVGPSNGRTANRLRVLS